MGEVDGDGLDISGNRVRMLYREVQQETALIGAKLEIGVLYEVVDDLVRDLSPLVSGAHDRKADGSLKASDELHPRRRIVRFGAGADQIFSGHGRIEHQEPNTTEAQFYNKF